MKLKKLNNRLYAVEFNTTTEMCHTVVRFSEHYENSAFKGKEFTKEEFKTWYKKFTGKKIYTYSRDWDGFNITGITLVFFRDLELDEEERKFLNLFKGVSNKRLENSYIIITAKNSEPTTYKHELTHAMYDTIPSYQKDVMEALHGLQERASIYKWFSKMGYHKGVWEDELNAYITEDYSHLEKKCKLKKDCLKSMSFRLNQLYEEYKT